MSGRGPLLIVGASGRAAAASAIRAGFDPFVIDLFADADTRRLCPTIHCPREDYPSALPSLAEMAPPGPWMYTGGLENHPSVVAAISESRPLSGNGPGVLAEVRNPFRLHEILSGKGLAHPWLNHPELRPPADIRWLRKPLSGSGGFGVRFATDDDIRRAGEPGADYYLQEFLPGPPMSAVYESRLPKVSPLGLTRQLVGEEWLHAKPFRFAGNIGPVRLTGDDGGTFLHAFRLTDRAGISGVWGFDFIPSDGEAYLIEVNPRYTASVEVLELAARPRVVGKAIYFAPHGIMFPASGPWDESLARCTDVWRRPDFADIPDSGTVVEPGHPVLTILTEAETESACLDRLKSRAAELDQVFGHTSAGGATG